MNVILGLCHSYSGKVVIFQESFLLVNASFRRRHVEDSQHMKVVST